MSKCEYSNEIANVVKNFLTENDWHYRFKEDTGVFRFNLEIRSKVQKIEYLIDIQKNEMVFYGNFPIRVDCNDAKRVVKMAEFICRANCGSKNGYFELDFNNGQICCKSFVDCEGLLPSTEVVENCIHYIAVMFECYASSILDIIFADSSAKVAIAKCEKIFEDEICNILNELEEKADIEKMEHASTGLSEDFVITENEDSDILTETIIDFTEIRVNPFGGKKEGSVL